jgi:hypothetical protein
MESLEIQEGLSDCLSLITTIGSDLSESEQQELIKKSYISSLAVKDFVLGELNLNDFLDIQEYCLTDSAMDNYLNVVSDNIENLSFAELLTT